jgi:endonuclease/exonuclease/phosphatase (EEP) superfamily protein YafD
VVDRLGLTAVEFTPDGRRRTFSMHLDHLFVRGFTVVRASAPEVKSSDHNPVLVTLVAR